MAESHRPTTRERLITGSVETLAPHHSLDRIDKASGTVTTAVTLAGTLAGGFGLIAATTLADVGIGWALPTVVLASISVACAVLATVPAPGTVAPGNLIEVEKFFRRQIQKRGGLVRVAAWTLAFAVLLAPLPIVAATLVDEEPAIDLTIAANGKDRKVVIGVVAAGLEENAAVTVDARRDGRQLAFSEADAGAKGTLKSSLTVPALPAGTQLKVTVRGPDGVPKRERDIVVPAAE